MPQGKICYVEIPANRAEDSAKFYIGLNDIELITVEGGGFGPEAADRAVSDALAKVSAIAA